MFKGSYGWKKQKEDKRDWVYKTPMAKAIALPRSFSLKRYDSPIQDQGSLGSCVAHATTGAIQLLELKEKFPTNPILSFLLMCVRVLARQIIYFFNFLPMTIIFKRYLSRLFVYYNARALEGTTSADDGCEIRDAIKTLAEQGVCMETSWPYNGKYNGKFVSFADKPADACYTEAATHKIVEYRTVTNLDDMKGCIASGFPFVFGFAVYESFETGPVYKTGIMSMPLKDEQQVGAHAVMALGYDDDKQMFLVRNSWNRKWGERGYFWMPYAYITDPGLAGDFWMIKHCNNL